MATATDLINKANEREKSSSGSKKPLFLWMSDKQKALFRPLCNLDQAIVLSYHNKWHENASYRVNAVCAREVGKQCDHCDTAKERDDKTLRASDLIFLPIYLYAVTDVKTGEQLTYTDKDAEGNKVQKTISGFRVLELPLYGKAYAIAQALNSHMRDDGSIADCDFSLEQAGEGKTKNFIISAKAPKPLASNIASAVPSLEIFRQRILEARPPAIFTDTPANAAYNPNDEVDPNDIDLEF